MLHANIIFILTIGFPENNTKNNGLLILIFISKLGGAQFENYFLTLIVIV